MQHRIPEGEDARVDVVEEDAVDIAFAQEVDRGAGAPGEGLDVDTAGDLVLVKEVAQIVR
jgi:hypothetical protein